MVVTLFFFAGVSAFSADYYYMQGGKRISLVPVEANETATLRDTSNILRFIGPGGEEIGIPDRLIVKFDDPAGRQTLLEKFGLEEVRCYQNGICLLEAPNPTAALEAANALSEERGVIFAQPDLIRKRSLR
ncbi:S8 family serine peptidase [Hydrogenimonas sp.]